MFLLADIEIFGKIKENIKSTSEWELENPILLKNEKGIEVIENSGLRMKVGDGLTPWRELSYIDNVLDISRLITTQTFNDISFWQKQDNLVLATISNGDELGIPEKIGTILSIKSEHFISQLLYTQPTGETYIRRGNAVVWWSENGETWLNILSDAYRKSNVSEAVQSLLSSEEVSDFQSKLIDSSEITSENIDIVKTWYPKIGLSLRYAEEDFPTLPANWGSLVSYSNGWNVYQYYFLDNQIWYRYGSGEEPFKPWISVVTENKVINIKNVTSSNINDFKTYHTDGNSVSMSAINPTNSNEGSLAPARWGRILTFSNGVAGHQFFIDSYSHTFAIRVFGSSNWNGASDKWESDNQWADLSALLGARYVEYSHLNLDSNTQVDINVPFGKTYLNPPKIMFSVGNNSKASVAVVNFRSTTTTKASFLARNVGANSVDVVIYMLILPNTG